MINFYDYNKKCSRLKKLYSKAMKEKLRVNLIMLNVVTLKPYKMIISLEYWLT